MAAGVQASSEKLTTIDRHLVRRLDGHDGRGLPPAPPPSSQSQPSRIDISAIPKAVKHTATSMTAMAERIEELEAHAQAFGTANDELEAQNQQLTREVDEIVQQRDSLAANLQAESKRLQQLENDTAQHVARANALERDLSATHASLTKIIDAVDARLG